MSDPTRQVFCLCGHDQHHHARSKGRCLQCECVKVNPLLTREEAANDEHVQRMVWAQLTGGALPTGGDRR